MIFKKHILSLVLILNVSYALGQTSDTTRIHTYRHPSIGTSGSRELRLGIGAKPFESDRFFPSSFLEPEWHRTHQTSELDININETYHEGARYTTGALFGEYIYNFNRYLEVGATFTFFSYYSNYYNNYNNKFVGNNSSNHFSFYPTIRLNYVNYRYLKIYSSVGLGARYVLKHDELQNNKVIAGRFGLAGQVTFIGFSLGRENFWFLDLCTFGTQGFITTGLGFKLK
jgi:hypothetical protein